MTRPAWDTRPVEALTPLPATRLRRLTRLRHPARVGQGVILWTSGWSSAWAVWAVLHLAGLA